jgi:phosphomannomutase
MPDASSYPPLAERPITNTVVLFDVDGTLTPARLVSVARAHKTS